MKYVLKITVDAVRWDGVAFSESPEWLAGLKVEKRPDGHCVVYTYPGGGPWLASGDYLVRESCGDIHMAPASDFEMLFKALNEKSDAED